MYTKSRRSQKLEIILAATSSSHLREARTMELPQILRAPMAVQACAAGDVRRAQSFFKLFRKKALFSFFLYGNTFLQSVGNEKQAPAKNSLLQSVTKITEVLLLLHSNGYTNSCLQDHRLHAKLHCKSGSQTGVAAQLVTKTWRALSKSTGLGSFQTAYRHYFPYDSRKALVHVLMAREEGV